MRLDPAGGPFFSVEMDLSSAFSLGCNLIFADFSFLTL